MSYTLEEYLRDLKISKYVFNKNFSSFRNLKEDLIQESIISLWKNKNKFNINKSNYSTWAYHIVYWSMCKYITEIYKITNSFKNISLDLILNEDSDFTLYNILSSTNEINTNIDLQYINNIIYSIINKQKNIKVKNILSDYIKGYNVKILTKKYVVSKQYISKKILNFRKELKNKLIKDNYL